MANPNRVGGVLAFTIDGVSYSARGNFKVTPGTVKREAVTGQDGPHGYTEMPITPSIEGEFTTRQGLSLTALEGIVDSTITAQLANGTTYVLSQAWTESAFEVETAEGKFGAKFYGLSCRELT
jgi:hypothetical protein